MKHTKTKLQFVICIRNEGSEDLVPGKVYRVLEDEDAAQEEYIRVVDESEEDYLYPASLFVPISLPQTAERALFVASTSTSIPAV